MGISNREVSDVNIVEAEDSLKHRDVQKVLKSITHLPEDITAVESRVELTSLLFINIIYFLSREGFIELLGYDESRVKLTKHGQIVRARL